MIKNRSSPSRRPEVELGRLDARSLQSRFPFFFDTLRVPIQDIARALGLRVEERVDLEQRAQLEILATGEIVDRAIILRPGLDSGVRRFAIAHEIGHFILLENRHQLSRTWDTKRRETFANWFAAELLLSPEGRNRIESTFRNLDGPRELLQLASSVGLSPHALLTQATANQSLTSGLGKIWLRVKYAKNAVTQRDPKLRIVSAHYDRERFYIAENQGFNRFADDESWLISVAVGATITRTSTVAVKFKRPPGAKPRFIETKLQAEVSALRLATHTIGEGSVFILLANVEKSIGQSKGPEEQ